MHSTFSIYGITVDEMRVEETLDYHHRLREILMGKNSIVITEIKNGDFASALLEDPHRLLKGQINAS